MSRFEKLRSDSMIRSAVGCPFTAVRRRVRPTARIIDSSAHRSCRRKPPESSWQRETSSRVRKRGATTGMEITKQFGISIPDNRHRTISIIACVLAGAVSWLGCAPQARAHGAAVVTDTMVSQSTRTQSNVPITFGQVFKNGDVPKGDSVAATLNGKPVALQADPKATNPDGSLRHAVLTVVIPSRAGKAKRPLAIFAASATAAVAPITLHQLLTTDYDARVSINLGGKDYTVNARALLQTANSAHACAPWNPQCNVWLSG
ncbi:MAG: hypothetical protein KGQ32_10085, partial [Xanthomonadaceae bacterium]|nr:hypothetical protein [Xanthomonadaceae bacterium]